MQVNSFKAMLAAVSVVTLAAACTPRHSQVAGVDALACPANASIRLTPAQKALTSEISKFEPCFDATKTFLSDKIGGITIEAIAPDSGTDELDGSKGLRLKGSLVLRAPLTTYTFVSDPVLAEALRAGKVFNVNIQDPDAKLEGDLGGLLDMRARCVDAACKTVSMWLQSYQLGRINSAGLVFAADGGGAYDVTGSQAQIVSVARFSRLNSRSNREDDPVAAPFNPTAHDTAAFPNQALGL